MEVKEALVEMSRLGRTVDLEELRAEESKLKIRLSAVQQLLAWKETIADAEATLAEIDSAPKKIKSPTRPITLKPTDEDFNRTTQPSVDANDPPSRVASNAGFPQDGEKSAGDDVLPEGPPKVDLPTGDHGKQFVEVMTRIVKFPGENGGKGKLSDILDAVGVSRKYLNNIMIDSRCQHRIEKYAFGHYQLTESGREMYTALMTTVPGGPGK